MRMDPAAALDAEYRAIDEAVRGLDEGELLEPSGCRGWSRADLLLHILLDAQRALVTLHSPSAGPADTDFASYWRGFKSSDDGARAHARFIRASAAAYRSPEGIATRWHETSAAAREAASAVAHPFVTTQGRVLSTGDFLATLVVEATIHHLDLLVDRPPPAPSALVITTATLDSLLGTPRPGGWDELTYVRKATGREDLDGRDRDELGTAAASIPLFS